MLPFSHRRGFLAGSAAALGSLAASTQLAAVEPGEKQEPVRIAIVGMGARGSDLARALTTIDRAKIVGICDDYEPHLAQGVKIVGPEAATFASLEKMLERIRPQAVVVATPLYLHHAMCLEALEAGAAVFCEKTMCHSIAQAREVAAAAEKRQAVFQVGLQRRANAIYAQAEAMVRSGMLGQIAAIKCQWHRNHNWRRPVPVPRGDERFTALERRLNWRLFREYSQGLMAELGSHQLDVVNRVLGIPPARVTASGGIDYWRDGREMADNVFCTYEYELPAVAPPVARPSQAVAPSPPKPRTVRVTYSSLTSNAFEGASELIEGDRGTLFLTQRKGLFYKEAAADLGWKPPGEAEQNAALLTAGKTLKMTNDPWAYRGKPFEIDSESDDTRDELVSFLDHVAAGNRATICDARTGLVNAATVLIANQAMEERKTLEFPSL